MHAPDRYELNAAWTIPTVYGLDRLVLMPKDPHWLYTYWELTSSLYETMRATYGDSWEQGRMVLRLFHLDNGNIRDIDIDDYADNWYLSVDNADQRYRAELGRLLADGSFIPLLQSNTVRTPRDSISSVIDPHWKVFNFWQQHYTRRMVGGMSSSELFGDNSATSPKGGF